MDVPAGHTTRLHGWLAEMRKGDVTARNEVIAHACDRLRTLTRRMLRGFRRVRRWAETDDVLQNSLLRLHRALAEVQPETPRQFYALAAQQIRRELLDLARQQYGPEGIGTNHDTDPGIAAEKEVSLADEPHDLEGWTRFHEQVEKLTDEQREVFDLLWYEGLTQPEAATVLSVSLKTVKRRWQDARLFLFEAMRGESPE
jgi:RNA polymerase sigma-70 factor (ECF subfamily)